MSLKKTLAKNTTLNLVGYLYVVIGSIISVPILLSKLGSQTYGIYLLFSGLIPLAASIDFGLSTATVRQLSLPDTSQKKRFKIWQSSLALYVLTGLLVSIGIFLISVLFLGNLKALQPLNSSQILTYSTLMALLVFINYLVAHSLSLPQARQNFLIYNIYPLLIGTGNTLLPALIVQYFPSIQAIFTLRIVIYLINLAILLIYAYSYFNKNPFSLKLHQKKTRSLLTFGFKHFIGNLSSQVQNQFSRYAIGNYLSAEAVSIFTIPHQVIIKAAGAISQGTLAFFPMSTSLTTKKRLPNLKKLLISIQLLILAAGILQVILIYNFGQPLLSWWLHDPQFASRAFQVLKVLSWFFLLTTLTPIPGAVLNSINKPHIPSFFAVFTTIITICLIIYLTPLLGATGPAYALVISSIIAVPPFLATFIVMFKRYCHQL